MAKSQTKGNPIAENMWLLASLISFFSGVVLLIAKYVAEKNQISLVIIVALFVMSALSFTLSEIYSNIVNVPGRPKQKSEDKKENPEAAAEQNAAESVESAQADSQEVPSE